MIAKKYIDNVSSNDDNVSDCSHFNTQFTLISLFHYK